MDGINVLRCDQFDEVDCFYRRVGYGGTIGETETILEARAEDRLVGVVRLVIENSFLVLRGMQVETGFQRRGVGGKLLEAAVEVMSGRECWCIPHSYLSGFYSGGGFSEVPSSSAPRFLADRLIRYNASGRSVVLMRRLAGAD